MRPAHAEIGKVLGPHGVKGEVRVAILSDLPNRIESLDRVVLRWPDGRKCWMELVSTRPHKQGLLVFFRGVGDRNAAEELRGAFLTVPADELPELPKDSYYVFDLIGSSVRTEGGELLCTVADVLSAAGNHVLVVDGTARGEVLLPLAHHVVRDVDLQAREITVHLLPGLLG